MEDGEVIEAFVAGGARRAFGPSLHVEGDALYLDGWWQTAFRVGTDAFIVRNEDPPVDTTALEALAGQLSGRGLQAVGDDLPAITAIIYAELAVGSLAWTMWATDRDAGEAALAARAGAESFFAPAIGEADDEDLSHLADFELGAGVGGARRLAGLPASLVLTVGMEDGLLRRLQSDLTEFGFVSVSLEDADPANCAHLMPTLVVVDATRPAGRDFLIDLRAGVWARTLPVAAVTDGPEPPPGADVALDAGETAGAWAEALRRLVP